MVDIEDHYILQQWMNTRAFNETNVLVVSFVYIPQDPFCISTFTSKILITLLIYKPDGKKTYTSPYVYIL